jgi:monoamine oxidase
MRFPSLLSVTIRAMARSPLMQRLQAIVHAHDVVPSPSRRRFLANAGALAAAAALPRWTPVAAATQARVVIVGAGLAGLSAAYTLAKSGVRATVYEGSPRLGGRCWTDRESFAGGQVAERGGELIDTTHEEIRALCAELSLPLDDLIEAERKGSEPLFFFDGAAYTTADVDRDFAAVRPRLAEDAKALGDDLPTYDKHTPAQRTLDRMSAAEWIDSRVPGGRGSRLGQLLVNAYGEELGADPEEISAITVVSLLAGSPADRFSPYEESDQRYHVRGGNDQIVTKLAERAGGDIKTHSRLVALSRRGDGRYRVVIMRDADTREEVADRVVLALPFTLLRLVDLRDAGFGPRKMRSINELGMGRNTKLQLQFADRFWLNGPGNGEYRLRGSFQTTWEVTRAQPGAAGILNLFSGGSAAVAAGLTAIDAQAASSLAELARHAPAAQGTWNRRVIRNAWDRNPWSLGSYALVRPGQYTSFYGVEAEPRGHVYFAGEHTSMESQGYLNGGVESGMRAAGEVLASLGATRMKKSA